MTFRKDLLQSKQEIKELAKKHGIKSVKVFGSVACGEDGIDSDKIRSKTKWVNQSMLLP